MKEKSNLAFIGTGWIGLNRMKSLLKEDLCNPVAILEPDPENAEKDLELDPGARIMGTVEELLKIRPDGIVIATPSALHASQCMSALTNGIPVFCQKPLARNADECYQVISAAYKSNKLLGVDLSYRYTDGMQKIYQLPREELGEIFAIDLVFNNAYGPDKAWFYNPQLSGGGCIIDLGVHMIDLALWILNFPKIKHVTSTLISNGQIILNNDTEDIVEDYASVQMETETGTLIRLVCSWNLSAGRDAEISASLYGTKGSALFYNLDGSFYNFEAAVCHGTGRRIISNPPDEWGGKAIIHWTRILQHGNHFRNFSLQYYNTAEVLDRIYNRKKVFKASIK